MSNTIRIKRRASGTAGAPSSLHNAELAFNEVDDTLYYGKGAGGVGGTATTVEAVAGRGAFVTLAGGLQSISGDKTFSGNLRAVTQPVDTNTTQVATTAYVMGQQYLKGNQTITFSGDVTGSGATAAALTLVDTGVTVGTWTKVTVDSKGRVTTGAILAASDIPTLLSTKISDFDTQVRTNRLDQMALPTANVSMNGRILTAVADPVSPQDAATKAYVDATRQGLFTKDAARVATTANITLSGAQTIDGILLVAGNRVLVKNQTNAAENGIYVVADLAWSRAADADASGEIQGGTFIFVQEGTVNADSGWVCTNDGTITLGTTAINWTQFSGAGQINPGTGLYKDGNTIHVGASTGIAVQADAVALTGQALALHNMAGIGMFARTGVDTIAARSIATSGTGISVANGDAQAGNPTVSLSTSLSTVGSLVPAADRLAYYSGASTATLTTLTAYGRSLLDDPDAATARATLALGTIATQDASNVNITGGSLTNLTTFSGITIDGGTF